MKHPSRRLALALCLCLLATACGKAEPADSRQLALSTPSSAPALTVSALQTMAPAPSPGAETAPGDAHAAQTSGTAADAETDEPATAAETDETAAGNPDKGGESDTEEETQGDGGAQDDDSAQDGSDAQESADAQDSGETKLLSNPKKATVKPKSTPRPTPKPANKERAARYPADLTLVNDDHKWKLDTGASSAKLSDQSGVVIRGELYANEVAAHALYDMLGDMREAGFRKVVIVEAHRSLKRQEAILDNRIKYYKDEGMSTSSATKEARKTVALPGYSEHHTGLAFDINDLDGDSFASTDEFAWLKKNAYKYGFIQRYTSQTKKDTGMSPESWHWRYVGFNPARVIAATGESLESYLKNQK